MYRFQPVLELLRNISTAEFQEAFGDDYGKAKGVNYRSFNTLLKSKLYLDVKDSDTYHLFCQIDRYSSESITSTELSNYLLEYEKKRLLSPRGPFHAEPIMFPGVSCNDSIIEWIQYPEIPDVQDEMSGHYIFVSKSGTIFVWNKEMEKRFQTTIETSDDGVGRTLIWATSITCLPKEKLIAVSTTSGDIRFFRSSIYKFDHQFSIICLPYIIIRLNCYAAEKLVCGDFSGNVFIIHIKKDFFVRNRDKAAHVPPEKIIFDNLKIGRVPGMAYEETNKKHSSPVQWIEYVPSLKAIISCCLNTKQAMMIHYLENNESLSFPSQGGINCFAYCKRQNCVITGGADHAIKIWNPRLNKTYSESLTGHKSPVIHLLVVEDRLFFISADREKTIRVWDLLRPKCLQIIKFKESDFPGKQSFSFMFLDPATQNLILATYRIGILEAYQTTIRKKTHPCSEYLLLAAYSPIYNCLVTVGNSSVIAVWDAETGALICEYENSHVIFDSVGIAHSMMILTAGLDSSQRRLITADRIGTIKVWNFHLGLCLKTFKITCRVLSLSFVGFHIYASGSSGAIVDMYDNGSDCVEPVTWDKRHSQSIGSLDYYRRNLIASASCDGEIFIWSRKSAETKVRLKDLTAEDEKAIKVDPNFLAKAELDRRRKCTISQLLFLQTREMDYFVGNLVSCGMDGYIRFWNIVCTNEVNEGKLLSKFRAILRKSDGVLCLATDIENRYLISGDTMGYIRVYELDNYYSAYGSAPPKTGQATSEQRDKFPFLRLQNLVNKKFAKFSKFTKESALGYSPFLLNSFQAHLAAILQVRYVLEKNTLITAGRDSCVRLWTISGVYIGCLGHSDEPWGFSVEEREKCHKPADVETVASALTLYVMNNGRMPLWKRVLDALKGCRLGHQPEEYKERPLRWKLMKVASTEELSAFSGTVEEHLQKRFPYFEGPQACKKNFLKDISTD